ncbi:MAG: HNH endonuclease signature motif containing protein [Cyanobacteria bacterium P01_F01_bin.150]
MTHNQKHQGISQDATATDELAKSFLELIEQQEQLEENLKQIKGQIKNYWIDNLDITDEDERLEIARNLYWHHPSINTPAIAGILGIPTCMLYKVVGPANLRGKCICCHANEFLIEVTSRANRSALQSKLQSQTCWRDSKTEFMCPRCQEKQKAKEISEKEAMHKEWRRKDAEEQAKRDRLRTMPYCEYLKTDHWQSIRQVALKRAGYACQVCNSKGILDVHHRTYERRGDEALSDLTVLCRQCHSTHHGHAEGAA